MIAPSRQDPMRKRFRRKPSPSRFFAVRLTLPPAVPARAGARILGRVAAVAACLLILGFSLWPVAVRQAAPEEAFMVAAEMLEPPAPPPPPEPPPPPPPPPPPKAAAPEPPPEKQFGMEKDDLAAESDMAVAMGNTVDARADTIVRLMPAPLPEAVPPKSAFQGKLGSVTRVSRMPRIKRPVKPEYTLEMRKNRVSGQVKARVLVDAAGKVAEIEINSDLGYGTRESAIAALGRMQFEPAVMDGSPVALWIPFTYTFELQE